MAALVAAIRVFNGGKDVHPRNKPGDDVEGIVCLSLLRGRAVIALVVHGKAGIVDVAVRSG